MADRVILLVEDTRVSTGDPLPLPEKLVETLDPSAITLMNFPVHDGQGPSVFLSPIDAVEAANNP